MVTEQVVLLMRGVLKGETSQVLAAELGLHYLTVLQLRRAIHERAQQVQATTPLDDLEVESDELFQNAGKKGSNTLTRLTHLVVGPTSGGVGGRMPMTARQCWEPLVIRVDRCACG